MNVPDLAQNVTSAAVGTALPHPAGNPEEVANDDASVRAWGQHPVNLRITIFGRYYVAFVAGKERRSGDRRVAERKKHPLETLGNMLATLAFSVTLGLAFYALQMTLGLWVLKRFIFAP